MSTISKVKEFFYLIPFRSFFLYIQTYQSRLIPEGVAETQIFLGDAHVLPK
jgi:hypothetical protein